MPDSEILPGPDAPSRPEPTESPVVNAEETSVDPHSETAELIQPYSPSPGMLSRFTGKSAPLPHDSGSFAPITKPTSPWTLVVNALLAILLLYLFLVGIECLSSGIKGLGKGAMDEHLKGALNPMLGLLAGILATTLVQSSSVTTALIVGFVASGNVSVASAVPMIMGANIGTTVTNTIASLAHSSRSSEFRRAFAAATCHDFFNFLAVITLLPLELITRAATGTGILERMSGWITGLTLGAGGATYKSPVKATFKAGREVVETTLALVFTENALKIALAVAGVVIIFATLAGIVKVMRSLVLSRMERYVNRFLGQGGHMGIVVGMVVTVMVQSSSITTSILVPLAGAGVMTLAQIYPITLGANLGTTITALLASMAVSGESTGAARQIAIVHLLFNIGGMLVWYVPRPLRGIPIRLAERLSRFAAAKRGWAIAYVVGVFYGLPAGIFFLSKALGFD